MCWQTVRLVLYVITATLRFTVAVAFFRMKHWLSRLLAYSLSASLFLDMVAMTVLMNNMGLAPSSQLFRDVLWTVSGAVNVSAMVMLAVSFYLNTNGRAKSHG